MVKALLDALQRSGGQFLLPPPQPIQTALPGTHGTTSSMLQIEGPSAHLSEQATHPPLQSGVRDCVGTSSASAPPSVPSVPPISSTEFIVVQRVAPSPTAHEEQVGVVESDTAAVVVPSLDSEPDVHEDEAVSPTDDIQVVGQVPAVPADPLPAIGDSDVPVAMDIESDRVDLSDTQV